LPNIFWLDMSLQNYEAWTLFGLGVFQCRMVSDTSDTDIL